LQKMKGRRVDRKKKNPFRRSACSQRRGSKRTTPSVKPIGIQGKKEDTRKPPVLGGSQFGENGTSRGIKRSPIIRKKKKKVS